MASLSNIGAPVLFFNSEKDENSSSADTRKAVMISGRPDMPSQETEKGGDPRPGTASRPTTSSGRPPTSGGRPGTASRKKNTSEFRRLYDRGELPVVIEERVAGRRLTWTVNMEQLNYQHYLPIFFSGLLEKVDPHRFVAYEGVFELLETVSGTKVVIAVLPQLVKSIKTALNTRDPVIVYAVLKVLQQLALCENVGVALGDHYRQLLPVCNILKDKHLGSGRATVGNLVIETLELLEVRGGPDAYAAIKHLVPSYESCLSPPPEPQSSSAPFSDRDNLFFIR